VSSKPAAAKQVGGAAEEHEQPAEGQGVGGRGPLQIGGGDAQVGLDGGQGHVGHRHVDDQHGLGGA
jgi:hypothetical protein